MGISFPQRINFPQSEGELSATPEGAHENTYYDRAAGAHVTDIEPTILITGTLKVRGIAYDVHKRYRWTRRAHDVYTAGRVLGRTHWQSTSHENGFRRVDSGKKPEWDSFTGKTLTAVVDGVLESLAARTDWRKASLRLRLESMLRAAETSAAQAMENYNEAIARAEKVKAELAEMG